MGVTAANVPSFRGQHALSLGDLQDLVEVVKALMLQSDAPPGRVRTGSAKAVPAHDPPEAGVYFNGKFYETKNYFRPRPGLVQDLAFATGVTEPCFIHGHGLLPLAQTVDESGQAHSTPVAGGITEVRENAQLSAPRILPGGIIELPPGSGAPLAEWQASGVNNTPGLLAGLSFTDRAARAENGCLYFPLAYFQPARPGEGTAIGRPGALQEVAHDPDVVAPAVFDGKVKLPLACYDAGPSHVNRPGAIVRVGYDSAVEIPYIRQGEIFLPLPGGGGKALAGLKTQSGSSVGWADVEGYAGSQVQVATVVLSAGSATIPLSLYAGYEGGYLTFSLSEST